MSDPEKEGLGSEEAEISSLLETEPVLAAWLAEDGELVVQIDPRKVITNGHEQHSSPEGEFVMMDGDPGVWGVLLADVFRHCVRAHLGTLLECHEKGHSFGIGELPTEDQICQRVMQIFVAELFEGADGGGDGDEEERVIN